MNSSSPGPSLWWSFYLDLSTHAHSNMHIFKSWDKTEGQRTFTPIRGRSVRGQSSCPLPSCLWLLVGVFQTACGTDQQYNLTWAGVNDGSLPLSFRCQEPDHTHSFLLTAGTVWANSVLIQTTTNISFDTDEISHSWKNTKLPPTLFLLFTEKWRSAKVKISQP